MSVFEGTADGTGRRLAIVASRFHGLVVERLVHGAQRGLLSRGVDPDDVDVAWVPGAFEIPPIARRFALSGSYDAVICLGVIVRGETAHFELVARETARGVADVSLETGVPVIFEVLATETLDQAEARAGGADGNRGFDAAMAALRMASLHDGLPKEGAT